MDGGPIRLRMRFALYASFVKNITSTKIAFISMVFQMEAWEHMTLLNVHPGCLQELFLCPLSVMRKLFRETSRLRWAKFLYGSFRAGRIPTLHLPKLSRLLKNSAKLVPWCATIFI